MKLRNLTMSWLLLACSADAVVAQQAGEANEAAEKSPIPIYVTPFYNSKGPKISVGEFSDRLAKADAQSILPLLVELEKKKGSLRAVVMYVVAIRLYDLGHKDEAVYWYHTAQYHRRVFASVVDKNEEGEFGSEAFELMHAHNAFFQLAGPHINGYGYDDLEKLEKTYTKVLKEGASLPDFAKIYPNVKFIKKEAWAEQNEEVSAGLAKLIERIKTDGDSIREQRRKFLQGESLQTPLLAAIESGNRDVFVSLLKNGADPNEHGVNGSTAVHLAAQQDDVFWLKEVLAHGGKVDVLNTGNRFYPNSTPLYYSLSKRRQRTSRVLINAGANLNHVDSFGISPVYQAMSSWMFAEAKLMIEKGADPKFWAEGKYSILDRSWFLPGREKVWDGSQRAEYIELYDILAKKGYLKPRVARAKKSRKPGLSFWAGTVLRPGTVLYALSYGPVFWAMYPNEPTIEMRTAYAKFYAPIIWFEQNAGPRWIGSDLGSYKWWGISHDHPNALEIIWILETDHLEYVRENNK